MASAVKNIPSGVGRERMFEQPARIRIARRHQPRYDFKIFSRLRLGPRPRPVGQFLELERRRRVHVARHAARVSRTFFEKNRLDARPVHLEIERLRRRKPCKNCYRGRDFPEHAPIISESVERL